MAIKPLSKAAVGAAVAGAMMISAAPAQARDRDHDGISAGEVIAGAVVIGGLAAILASSNDDRYGYDGRYDSRYNNYRGDRYRDGRYNNRYGNSRAAVNQCVRAAQNRASRYGRADVTEVTGVDRKRYGYKVKGRLVVQNGYRGYGRNYDKGKFSCVVNQGRVQDIRFSGLRH